MLYPYRRLKPHQKVQWGHVYVKTKKVGKKYYNMLAIWWKIVDGPWTITSGSIDLYNLDTKRPYREMWEVLAD